jgi:hypothetical protein
MPKQYIRRRIAIVLVDGNFLGNLSASLVQMERVSLGFVEIFVEV